MKTFTQIPTSETSDFVPNLEHLECFTGPFNFSFMYHTDTETFILVINKKSYILKGDKHLNIITASAVISALSLILSVNQITLIKEDLIDLQAKVENTLAITNDINNKLLALDISSTVEASNESVSFYNKTTKALEESLATHVSDLFQQDFFNELQEDFNLLDEDCAYIIAQDSDLVHLFYTSNSLLIKDFEYKIRQILNQRDLSLDFDN